MFSMPIASTIRQKRLMQFNPETGVEALEPIFAEAWRKQNKGAWLFNPWTGVKREAIEIGDDVFGFRIQDGVSPFESILTAIRQGSVAHEILDLMKESDFSVDESIGEDDEPVLMIAAYHGRVTLVEELLRRGANARCHGQGVSALCFGARHSAVLKVLRETDAKLDVNRVFPPNFFTPLMQALNISTGDPFGRYDFSLVDDRLESVRILFELGADIDAQNCRQERQARYRLRRVERH